MPNLRRKMMIYKVKISSAFKKHHKKPENEDYCL